MLNLYTCQRFIVFCLSFHHVHFFNDYMYFAYVKAIFIGELKKVIFSQKS